MAEGTVTDGWLHDTLEQLIAQIRALLDVTGVAFVTVDEERAAIRPAAAWFTSDDASRAFTPLLDRPYDPERGGVTEAAVESGTAVLIPRISEWPGAEGLRDRLVRAPRRPARAGRVGLLRDRLVHLRARAHRRRPHVRRAGDLLQPAAAPAQRGGPALGRGVRAARRAGARALRAARARGRGCGARRACSTARCRRWPPRSTSRPSTARSSSMRASCRAPRACCSPATTPASASCATSPAATSASASPVRASGSARA